MHVSPDDRKACCLLIRATRILIALIAAFAVTTAMTSGVAMASSASAQQEAATEVAEESAESAEDAASAPFDLAVAQTHHRYLARIEYLKG